MIVQEVDVPILNNTICQSMFLKSGNMKPIKPSFICAGGEPGKDSCGGDSGKFQFLEMTKINKATFSAGI